jgi:diguanylate cyclase (GGDEF)-like protein
VGRAGIVRGPRHFLAPVIIDTTIERAVNQNVLILLTILVSANVILIALVVIRSLLRRNRSDADRVPGPGDDVIPHTLAPRGFAPLPTSSIGVSATNRTDPLTGLLLPGEWNRIIGDEDARFKRYGHPATIVIIELDGLDRLITALGREAGDRILPAVADALSRNARGADHLARLGPGRFGILLPETGEVAAVNYVERVREACELWLEAGAIALELAIGWASPGSETSLSDALSAAQERMFAELRRNARRATDIEAEGPPTMPGFEGSPSPA